MNHHRLVACILVALLCCSVPRAFAAGVMPNQPIIYVTQVPTPDNVNNIVSTFGNHEAKSAHAPRGGDLMIRYVDGTVKNLTSAAGYGKTGFQDSTSIAVRQPCVHWTGTKAVFSMVVGSPASANDTTQYFWQLYEITGIGQGQTPVITKVPNQPTNCNSISPIYGTDEHIIFICDRARNGAGHLYPQFDEYRLDPTNTGLWNLDPTSGSLFLMTHQPSGAFWPSIDSYGRVILTRWDHLERDVTADADTVSQTGTIKGTFNYADESAAAAILPRQEEAFPEPSPVRQDLVVGTNQIPMEFNQFFPWMINEDGTGEETINHIGRHEMRFALGRSFNDDPNLVNFNYATSQPPRLNQLFVNNMLQIREDPAHPGLYIGVDANEFGTHAAGQLYSLNGPPNLPADQMKITFITDRSTEGVTQEGQNPPPQHTGHYRNPLPFLNGALVCAHTTEAHTDFNIGTATNPASRYAFRLKNLMQSGSLWIPDQTLTSGTTKSVSYYTPVGLVTYSGVLWELDPVNVAVRTKPVAAASPLGAPEQAIFDQEGVNVSTFKTYMAQNNLALIVSRNLTTRDKADKQQPFNLNVAGSNGVQTVVTSGKVYDIAALQIFQADQLRGLTGTSAQNAPPLPGRRPVAVPMHDPAVNNPPNPGGPAGSVKISTLDGSMAAFVPVRRAMTWQMTDPNGAPVVRERYWLTFQPGEIRTCTSCHGVNSGDQKNNPGPTNSPEALRDLLQYWKSTTAGVAGSLKFSNSTYSVNENGNSATITVSRVGGSTGAISVHYATIDGTATAPAKYTATSGTLNWADADMADKTFTVSIIDNVLVDGNKTVYLSLTNPTNSATLGTPNAAVLTILDDDVATPPGPQFVSGPTATPSPATVNTSVTISCTVTGSAPITLAWDLGDGTLLPASASMSVQHTYQSAGTYTIVVTALDGNAKTAQGQTTIKVNAIAPGPQFTGGPTPNPNPAVVNTSVTVGCTVTGTAPITIAWDFGDGSTLPAGSATSVMHTYTTAGSYVIKATATDGNNKSALSQNSVTISPVVVPPTGVLSPKRGTIVFNFKTHNDTCTITGTLPLGPSFVPTGQNAMVSVGSISATLPVNGQKVGTDSLKLGRIPKAGSVADAPVDFTLVLNKQDLFTQLAQLGFTNANVNPAVTVNVPLNIVIAGKTYHADIPFSYYAKVDKTGTAKY